MNLNPFWSMSTNTGRKVRERSSFSALKDNFCQVHPTHKREERQKNRIFKSSQRDPHTLKVRLVWSVFLTFSHKDGVASFEASCILLLLPPVFCLRGILEDWNCGMGMSNLRCVVSSNNALGLLMPFRQLLARDTPLQSRPERGQFQGCLLLPGAL